MIHSCVILIVPWSKTMFILHLYQSKSHSSHEKLRSPSLRCLGMCNPSCLAWFSSCVASRTSLPSLAHSHRRRNFPQHDNIHLWETYKCRLLFDWCSRRQPFPSATILVISWATASCGCTCRKPRGTHKHNIHTILSLEVVWRTAYTIYNGYLI